MEKLFGGWVKALLQLPRDFPGKAWAAATHYICNAASNGPRTPAQTHSHFRTRSATSSTRPTQDTSRPPAPSSPPGLPRHPSSLARPAICRPAPAWTRCAAQGRPGPPSGAPLRASRPAACAGRGPSPRAARDRRRLHRAGAALPSRVHVAHRSPHLVAPPPRPRTARRRCPCSRSPSRRRGAPRRPWTCPAPWARR